MFTSITTNGTSGKKSISGLKNSGLNLLSVSLDHWDEKICDEIRRQTAHLHTDSRLTILGVGPNATSVAAMNKRQMIVYFNKSLNANLASASVAS